MQRGQEGELRKDATLTFTNGRHVYIITAVTTKQLTTTIVTESTSTTSIVDVITRCRFSYVMLSTLSTLIRDLKTPRAYQLCQFYLL